VPTLSIVVPCHNEQSVMPLLLSRLHEAGRTWDVDYEILCVDDGSRDGTWDLLARAAAADPRVRGVRLARNFGQQAAIAAGLSFARGAAVVVIDADLQDPPEVIADLLRVWREGFQVVHAVRSERQDALVKRALASGFYRVLASLVPFTIPRDSGEFVLLDRVIVDLMNALPEQDRYLRGLRAWCGFRQAEVAYKRGPRAGGAPQYTFWKSLTLAIDGVVSFSTVPLRLATYLGAAAVIAAMLALAWTAMAEGTTGTRAALPALTPMIVLLVGGAQLLCLGIIGEYLGRIAKQVKGRPLWIASETTGALDGAVTALYPAGTGQLTRFESRAAGS
jgi:dolichol-phosphate mannosyltransferase